MMPLRFKGTDGLHWKKPAMNLIAYGAAPPPPPPCSVGRLGGGDLKRANMTLSDATAYCSMTNACSSFTAEVPAAAACPTTNGKHKVLARSLCYSALASSFERCSTGGMVQPGT